MNCNTTHYRANSSSVPGDPTIILLIDAAVTVAAVVVAPTFAPPAFHSAVAWNAALIANFAVWTGVVMVGLAGWVVDFVEGMFASRSREAFAPAVPDAMQEIIAAPRHESAIRSSNATLRLTRDTNAAAKEARELESQGV